MPKFDAGAVVESLEWDFTGAGVPELVKAKGIVPEPSDAAIGRFLDGLKQLYLKSQGEALAGASIGPDATPEDMLDALSSLSGDDFVSFMADTAGLFAELCGDSPSQAQLLALPARVRVRFYGWIQAEVVSPEAAPAAGIAEVKMLPSAAGG